MTKKPWLPPGARVFLCLRGQVGTARLESVTCRQSPVWQEKVIPMADEAWRFIIPMIHTAYGFAGIFTSVAILLFLPVIPLLLWGQRTGGKSLEEIE